MPNQDFQNIVRLLRLYAPNIDVADHGEQPLYPLNEGGICRFVAFHDGLRPFYPLDPDNAEHHRAKIYAEQGTGKVRFRDPDTFDNYGRDYSIRSLVQHVPRADAKLSATFMAAGQANTYSIGPTWSVSQTTLADDTDASSTFVMLSGATGSGVSLPPTTLGVRVTHSPEMYGHFKTKADITSMMFAIGFFAATPSGLPSAYPAGAGWRYDTNAPDPGWVAFTSDGTNTNVSAKLLDIAASTTYKFRVRIDGSVSPRVAYFSIGDTLTTSYSTNLPADATALGVYCYSHAFGVSSKSMSVSRAYVEWN